MSQNTPVGGVGQVRTSDDKAIPGQPGELSSFDDGSWRFTGNGTTTPNQVAELILAREAQRPGGQDLQPMVGNPVAQKVVANSILDQNKGVKGLTLDGAVPKGESLDVSWKAVVKELAKNIDEIRSFVGGSGSEVPGMDPKAASLLGKRGGGGRTLPNF